MCLVNTQTFLELTPYLNMVWSAPLQIIIATIMLWQHLGVASLAGLVPIFIFIPINAMLANRGKKLQLKKLKKQDARIKLTNEILSGIKVLKFYGWEISFNNILSKIREDELGIFKKMQVLNVAINTSWGIVSFLIATVSFIVYLVMDPANDLDAKKAFVSIALFNILRFPLMILPLVITGIIQTNVSFKRIRAYLLREEIDDSQITHEKQPGKLGRINLIANIHYKNH